MRNRSQKFLLFTFVFVMGAILFLFLLFPLLIGVWLPDLFFAHKNTLASKKISSGYDFRVVQYWNRGDFYSTELHVTSPDGRTEVHTLDGDDSKRWRLPLAVDEQYGTATVTLEGGRVRKVNWR